MRKLVGYIVDEVLGVIYYLHSEFLDKKTGVEIITSLSRGYLTATEICNTDSQIEMSPRHSN